MDRKHRLIYGRYLRGLADKLELRDWTVDTDPHPCADGANAMVQFYRGKKWLTVSFKTGFEERSREAIRLTCVHELLHAHTSQMAHLFTDAEKNHDHKWLCDLWWHIDLTEEYAIAAYADIIAPFMPLPPEIGKKKGTNHGKGKDAPAVSQADSGDAAGRDPSTGEETDARAREESPADEEGE